MSRTQQEVEFDFSKTITAPLKKLERQKLYSFRSGLLAE